MSQPHNPLPNSTPNTAQRNETQSGSAQPGVTVDVATLMQYRFSQASGSKKLKRSAHKKKGHASSVFKGRGMTFSEVRLYQPGDDARSIDWRVTARRGGEPHTKVFQEEREQPVFLVIDQRAHLFFGTRRCFKSVLACELGALFAWEAVAANDRAAHLIFTDSDIDHHPPSAGVRGVMHALQAMVKANQALFKQYQAGKTSTSNLQARAQQLIKAISAIHHLAKPGAHVFIISDFFGLSSPGVFEQIKNAMSPLVSHTHTYGLCLYDQFESTLPPSNHMLLSDGVHRCEINSTSHDLRKQYRSQFDEQINLVEKLFTELGCPLSFRGTHQITDRTVLNELGSGVQSEKLHATHTEHSDAHRKNTTAMGVITP